ncbi:MAG: hypothetical protein ACRENE_11045 [Polyangiaceae bacterium]
MAASKKPPHSTPHSTRTGRTSLRAPSSAAPRPSKAPAPKIIESGDRLAELEESLAKANVEIALLRQRSDAMQADLAVLRSLVVGLPGSGGSRKGPPPLPVEHRHSNPEIIMVDERDVTLESIRPKGR